VRKLKRVLLERTLRTKLVNFRISEDEAAVLIQRADASGARSVSEYVRLTALEIARKDLRRREGGPAVSAGQVSGGGGDENSSFRLLLVLRALEDALRDVRREIVKD
jgi:hypothetical protein